MNTLVGLLKAMNEKKMTPDELSKGLDKELASYNDADAKKKKDELDKFEMATFSGNKDAKQMKRGTFDKEGMQSINVEVVMNGVDGLKGKTAHTFTQLNTATSAGSKGGEITGLVQDDTDKSYDKTSYSFGADTKINMASQSIVDDIMDAFKEIEGATSFIFTDSSDKETSVTGNKSLLSAINGSNLDDIWVVGKKSATGFDINNDSKVFKLKLVLEISDKK